MKNRIISIVLTALMLLSVIPLTTSAKPVEPLAETYSGTCGENVNWTLDTETGVLSINGSGRMYFSSYVLYSPWYSYRSYIRTVNIDNGVTSIGDHAFHDCYSLTSVTIGNSVTSIGDYAFKDCASLTSITIPNSVTSIGDRAFEISTVIYGYSGSYANQYALQNGYTFIPIG